MEVPTEHDVRELGLWWLPENRDHQVAGVLTYSPTTGAQLELIGSLKPPSGSTRSRVTLANLNFAGDHGRICGMAGNRSFTLEGCSRTSLTNMLDPGPGRSVERIHVNRFVRGAEFEAGEIIDATRLDARLLHLPYWIAEGGLREIHTASQDALEGVPRFTLEAHRVPREEIQLDNGMRLTITEELTFAGDMVTGRGVKRDFLIGLEGRRLELEEYLMTLYCFQDLVSVGTGMTSTFEELAFHHPDIVKAGRGDDEAPTSKPIDFFAQWANWETRQPDPPTRHDILFDLSELGGSDAIRRWCALAATHRGTIARVMATKQRIGGLVSDDLLNRAAALEALDRDLNGDDIHFRKRMVRLATLAGQPFAEAVGDVDRWASLFKTARNNAAHRSNRHPREGYRLDHALAESGYFLFILCFLRLADAAPAAFEGIGANEPLRRVGRELGTST